ncbi:hypothetical protein EVAR_92501_1 [Eumeta japonica]|uniref:Uncharacterized protein n=1 Tax=Eumeta variegata TaxID=151549 RepID=A0A4C1T632_EUMVA|nr:hypothetical protein EVAR_92501_1 [Eumeta japonica]
MVKFDRKAAYPPSAQARAAASRAKCLGWCGRASACLGARLLDRARLGPEPSVVGKLDALKGASEAIPKSSQISDVERHTETENAPTKSQLPEASIEEAPPQQQQDLASEASMPSPSEPARKKKRHNPKKTQPQEDSADIMLAEALECLQSLRPISPIHTLHLKTHSQRAKKI